MNFERDAHVAGPPARGDGRGIARSRKTSSDEHRENNIETLFRTYLAQTYGPSIQVPAAAAASSQRLRAIWRQCGAPATFDQFAQDVLAALQRAYDRKYGLWDDVNDLRTLYPDCWHTSILPYTSSLSPDAKVLGVGINDGREVRQVFDCPHMSLDLVDISAKAIEQLIHRLSDYSRIRSFVGTFEDWASDRSDYDFFFSLRTLNCTAVDRSVFIRKSIELVKPGGTLIYSVSNGYVQVDNGVPKALNGMFSYETGRIDAQRPREIADEICGEVDTAGARVLELAERSTEIFIVATRERSPRTARHGLR